MNSVRTLSVLAAALLCAAQLSSAQSMGPFEGAPAGRPVSARQDQLTASDTFGKGAVLVISLADGRPAGCVNNPAVARRPCSSRSRTRCLVRWLAQGAV